MLVSEQSQSAEENSLQIDAPHDSIHSGERIAGSKAKRRRRRGNAKALRALANLSSLFEQMLYEQSEMKLQLTDVQNNFTRQPVVETSSEPSAWKAREAQLIEEIDRLHNEINSIAENVQSSAASEDFEHRIRLLENSVQTAEQTAEELAQENRHLRNQIAAMSSESRRNAPAATSSDNLSWDDRKKLLMQELDGDSNAETHEAAVSDPDALAHLIQSSQVEIERRDREIEELKKLLATQTERASEEVNNESERTKLLDSDEIIQQERQRLRTIQSELDDKLRKAEVDLSLERARLARERQQVEDRQQALKNQTAEDDSGTPAVKKRNWLASLGLDTK